jgi:hypothetical protein
MGSHGDHLSIRGLFFRLTFLWHPGGPRGTPLAGPVFYFKRWGRANIPVLGERRLMAQCVTCGSELHPERAEKYDYCTAPDCQKKNLKGLTMVAVGVNKAAEQYLVLDEQTSDDLASGKYHDQRRGSFGTSVASTTSIPSATVVTSATPAPTTGATSRAGRARTTRHPAPHRPATPVPARRPWSKSQEKLALLYNEQGRRPEEIAQKLGLSTYTVTQIILTSRNQGKL